MRIQPHENLSVWSARQDQFWHDRHARTSPARDRGGCQQERVHQHIHKHFNVTQEPRPIRSQDRFDVVHHTNHSRPADCHRYTPSVTPCSQTYSPYMPDVWQASMPPTVQLMLLMVIYDKSGLSQGFSHGQSVPAAGSFLDVFA